MRSWWCDRSAVLILVAAASAGLANGKGPTTLPARGGPYKVIAEEFTGDGIKDLAIGYLYVGTVVIERGDGRGNFTPMAVNPLCENCPPEHQGAIYQHHRGVYNLAAADIDRDGRADLAAACVGNFVVVARNIGQGRFERAGLFPTNPADTLSTGIHLTDLDNDGRPDLLYTSRGEKKDGTLYLRRNLGDWRFGPAITAAAGVSAYFIETADLNGDGYADVLVPNELGTTVSYWLNPGKDIFAPGLAFPDRRILQTSGRKVNNVRAADLNGDGHVDLVTANWVSSTISVFPGRGNGTFGEEVAFPGGKDCCFLGLGDLDRDGDVDLAVAHWRNDVLSVFLNDGHGRFAGGRDYRTGAGNYGIAVFDTDGDRVLDIVTANYRAGSVSLLRGNGDGSLNPAATRQRWVERSEEGWTPHRPTE